MYLKIKYTIYVYVWQYDVRSCENAILISVVVSE